MKIERLKKLEGVAQELLTRIIFEELEDVEKVFGIITVTGVKVSSDLSYLDIFVSCFKEQKALAHTLARHGYDIQKRLNAELNIRKLPKVRFRYTNEGELTGNINKLISELNIPKD